MKDIILKLAAEFLDTNYDWRCNLETDSFEVYHVPSGSWVFRAKYLEDILLYITGEL